MVTDPHVALRRFFPKTKTFNEGQHVTNVARQDSDARALGTNFCLDATAVAPERRARDAVCVRSMTG